MTHCGVSLHCYGQGKVDGGSEAALCQGEQDRYKVQVEGVQVNTGSMIINSELNIKTKLFHFILLSSIDFV